MKLARDILIDRRYLNLPVKRNAKKQYISLLLEGTMFQQFEIELAADAPDYWVFADLGQYMGKSITIALESADVISLEMIKLCDEIIGQDSLYSEKYRPQYHFTSKRGWLNDPVGLHYNQGEYHLFYQHNPHGTAWGNMHWGHAVSSDLTRWEELGDVLCPDGTGTMFSGSGVVDRRNTAGFKTGAGAPQVLIYTAAGGTNELSKDKPFTQCLAYSNDSGRTWKKYENNPVLPHICGNNRDPKVFWHEAAGKWIMALYLKSGEYALFSSPDLKAWEKTCDVEMPGCAECPDFFPLSADGDDGHVKWVFWAATRGAYLVGDFDGRKFTRESDMQYMLAEGAHSYAAQTFNDIPAEDGRRIQMSWANFDLPGMPFNCFLTFPCELTLRKTKNGYRLLAYPVREIERLRGKKRALKDMKLTKEIRFSDISRTQLDISAVFDVGSAVSLGIDVFGTTVTYQAGEAVLTCGSQACRMETEGGRIRLRILVDTASIEVFGNDGTVYMPLGILHERPENGVGVFSHHGIAGIESLEIYELNSIWEPQRSET